MPPPRMRTGRSDIARELAGTARPTKLASPRYESWWAQPTLQIRAWIDYWANEEKSSQTANVASMASASESAEASGPLWPCVRRVELAEETEPDVVFPSD